MAYRSRTLFAGIPEMKKYLKSAFLGVIVITAVIFLLHFSQDAEIQAVVNNPEASTKLDEKALEAALTAQALQPLAAKEHAASLSRSQDAADMLRGSRDYRVVHEALTQAGTTEARFYAKDILRRCLAMRKLGFQPIAVVSAQQEFARELLQARCSSFSDEELSLDALRQVDSDPRYPRGLFELSQEWTEAADAGNETRQKDVFSRILQADDALLLQHVGLSLLGQYRDAVSLGDVEFIGNAALNSMRWAWIAAVCEGTGTDCGVGDAYLVEICANMDICESSRIRALRALVARDEGEKQLAKFDAAHAMFVKAIQSRDVRLFFPQHTQ
ncbi:hypothetical protein HUK68_13510 [Comamonas antarctica]|uniref:Uncharacterized protein n=2 Tax=Comamonas antarctica TaxID=2743470 RepID=A0A6N1X7I5_9BURK|nr:hypothetical protein HUK68_13510 [Comamonas antarctica]